MCARLASIEKAAFYPTPTNVVEDLVRCHIRLSPWTSAQTYILDPCAGEGQAVHTFAQALKSTQPANTSSSVLDMMDFCRRQIHVKAVEIDAERAAAASELLGAHNVLHSPIENVSAVGRFSMMWLNPPYDQLPGLSLIHISHEDRRLLCILRTGIAAESAS